jgi:predicted SprT family Zn-dependent metalloprotease
MKTYKLIDNTIVTRNDMLVILDWCKNYLGRSKYFSVKNLKLRVKKNSKFLGHFNIEENHIEINPYIHESFIDLIETIIHEYVHFLQNPKEGDYFDRQYEYKYYYDHPHEYEAESMALMFNKKCYKDIKYKLS